MSNGRGAGEWLFLFCGRTLLTGRFLSDTLNPAIPLNSRNQTVVTEFMITPRSDYIGLVLDGWFWIYGRFG